MIVVDRSFARERSQDLGAPVADQRLCYAHTDHIAILRRTTSQTGR